MKVGHLYVSGEATRREYAVYVTVARHRISKQVRFYVGKTGDNRKGCNPMISRAGNHLSFNLNHAQLRKHLVDSEQFDFDFFFVPFGSYVRPSPKDIDLVNEMERRLNVMAQETFGTIMNPLKRSGFILQAEKELRCHLATPERLARLRNLIAEVRHFIRKPSA